MSSLPRVAVFDADYGSTLSVIRALVRVGAPFRVFHPKRHCLCGYSRHVEHVHPCPDPDDYTTFPDWLREQLRAGVFDVVMPTSDVICFHIANTLDCIDPDLASRLPVADAFLDVLLKDRFASTCKDLGIPTPRTHAPTSVEDAVKAAESIGYPVILKPRTHIVLRHVRGQVVYSSEDMRRSFREYALTREQQPVKSRFPHVAWPLVQACVPRTELQLSGSGMLSREGRSLAKHATYKMDQSPSFMGTGLAFGDASNDDYADLAAGQARQLLGRGLYELESLKQPGSDELLVIDVNPRAYQQIDFDYARGSDLIGLWYQDLIGADTPPAAAPAHDRSVWIIPAPLLLAYATRIISGPHRWFFLKRLWTILRRTRAALAFDWRDPLGTLACIAWSIRHPQNFVRPHWRERRDAHAPFERFDHQPPQASRQTRPDPPGR